MKCSPQILFLLIFIVCVILTACVNDRVPNYDYVKSGEYLVKESNCSYCHTPLVVYNGEIITDLNKMFSGHPEDAPIPEIPDVPIDSDEWLEFLTTLDSTVWAGEWGITFSANITPHKETGIGQWDKNVFIQTMRQGKHRGIGRNIQPPMPWKDYSKLTDDELISIFQYLLTVKPIRNKVPNPIIFNGK